MTESEIKDLRLVISEMARRHDRQETAQFLKGVFFSALVATPFWVGLIWLYYHHAEVFR